MISGAIVSGTTLSGTIMQNFISSIFIILSATFLISCSSSTKIKDVNYNPDTQEIEKINYTPFFQLDTELIPQQLELTLVTHLDKKTVLPGVYSLKKYTRRQLPNDYLADGHIILYLKNLTEQELNIEFYSISVEQKHLPFSVQKFSIPANEELSLSLGKLSIDLRLTSLFTRIEYQSTSHMEKVFAMKRIGDADVEENSNKD